MTATTHRLVHTDYVGKIDALRAVFATPGVHVIHDTNASPDRLEGEANGVITIHGRDATVTRPSPLVLRIEVRS